MNDTVGVYRTGIVKLVSSASDALELESSAIVQVLRYAERSGTLYSANPDPLARSPNPSS